MKATFIAVVAFLATFGFASAAQAQIVVDVAECMENYLSCRDKGVCDTCSQPKKPRRPGPSPKKTDPKKVEVDEGKVLCVPPATQNAAGDGCECNGAPAMLAMDGPKLVQLVSPKDKVYSCQVTHKDFAEGLALLLKIHRATCEGDDSVREAARREVEATKAKADAVKKDPKATEAQKADLETGKSQLEAEYQRVMARCQEFYLETRQMLSWRKSFEDNAKRHPPGDEKHVPDLDAESWSLVWLRSMTVQSAIDGIRQDIEGIKDRLTALEGRVTKVEILAGENRKGFEKICKLEEGQKPEDCNLEKGGLSEVQILVGGNYNARPQNGATDSGGFQGNVNLVFMVDDRHGVLLGGIFGYQTSRDSDRALVGGRLNWLFKLDEKGTVRFLAGGKVTAENVIEFNDALNFATPEIGLQFVPGGNDKSGFMCDVHIGAGPTRAELYNKGRRQHVSKWGLVISPEFSCGYRGNFD